MSGSTFLNEPYFRAKTLKSPSVCMCFLGQFLVFYANIKMSKFLCPEPDLLTFYLCKYFELMEKVRHLNLYD